MDRSEPKKLTFMKPKKIIQLINMAIETQTIMIVLSKRDKVGLMIHGKKK